MAVPPRRRRSTSSSPPRWCPERRAGAAHRATWWTASSRAAWWWTSPPSRAATANDKAGEVVVVGEGRPVIGYTDLPSRMAHREPVLRAERGEPAGGDGRRQAFPRPRNDVVRPALVLRRGAVLPRRRRWPLPPNLPRRRWVPPPPPAGAANHHDALRPPGAPRWRHGRAGRAVLMGRFAPWRTSCTSPSSSSPASSAGRSSGT